MITGGLPEGGVRVSGWGLWAGKEGVVWKLSAGFDGSISIVWWSHTIQLLIIKSIDNYLATIINIPQRPNRLTLHAQSLPVRGIIHAVIVIPIAIVPPVRRERMRTSAPPLHRKGEYEHNDLCSTVHRRREDIIILDKPLRMVRPNVPLGREADEEIGENGGVDADTKPADIVGYDGGVPVPETGSGEQAVEQVEGKGDHEADEEGESDPLVTGAVAEHVAGKSAPGNGLRVVLLDVLAGPDIGALDGEEDIALVVDNGDHHDVVEDGTNHSSDHLSGESGPRR